MFRALLRRPAKTRTRALLACPRCDADALCPIEWVTFGDDAWLMWMRCGECGCAHEAIVGNETAAAIDIEMDRQQAWIAARADALSHERMKDEVEAFAAALRRDLVDASDFAR
jgi:uncharacterized Zn finger protein